jgi:hypothetical protein
VPVVADVRGVGRDLQDHLEFYLQYAQHSTAHRIRSAAPPPRG